MTTNRTLPTLDNFAQVPVEITRVTGLGPDGKPGQASYMLTLNPYLVQQQHISRFREDLPQEEGHDHDILICAHIVAEALAGGITLTAESHLDRAEELLRYLTIKDLEKCIAAISVMGELDSFF